jgi:hypothetical protein
MKGPRFFTSDQDRINWKTNPGVLANQCHADFSRVVARDSLEEIDRAIRLGANVIVSQGFHAQNTKLALGCDTLIAFSWSTSSAPIDGGTYDTWSKCKNALKIHFSLHDQSKQQQPIFSRKHKEKEEEDITLIDECHVTKKRKI